MIGIGLKRGVLRLSNVQRTKVHTGLVWIVVFLAFLAILGYAETVWLPNDLPRESATRITLVALPTPDAVVGRKLATLPADWDRLVMKEAAQPELMRQLISELEMQDSTTGDTLSSQQFLQGVKQGGQCIEVNSTDGRTTRGLLVYSVFRGADPALLNKLAQEWGRLFVERSAAAFPGLVIQTVDSLGIPYQICRAP